MGDFRDLINLGPFYTVTIDGNLKQYTSSKDVAYAHYKNGLEVTVIQMKENFVITFEYKSTKETVIKNGLANAFRTIKSKYNSIK